jgi:succinate dehydrogenase/fumarate reductase cytochrome b subunit
MRVNRHTSPPHGSGHRGRRLLVVGALVAVSLLTTVAAANAAEAGVLVLAQAESVEQVLENVRGWVVGILALLATVFLTIGGVRYILGSGDPGEIEKAKVAFRSACVGYALAILAPLVVTVLQGIVGA